MRLKDNHPNGIPIRVYPVLPEKKKKQKTKNRAYLDTEKHIRYTLSYCHSGHKEKKLEAKANRHLVKKINQFQLKMVV